MNARTCVGCRRRADADDLMRIVVDRTASALVAVVDRRRCRPGRGAHLHPARDCFDQAVRRRAFPRALRVTGALDVQAVEEAIGHHLAPN
ncbi:YlxR family protein [Antricoccus suffuscus]|uniref:YlxR family protein n=1 Tax=Antricoccus suffuscus TaxID=1629062 RepID=UPI001EDDECFB|nr:YlxR family protein [Antricoccus suffuscus]